MSTKLHGIKTQKIPYILHGQCYEAPKPNNESVFVFYYIDTPLDAHVYLNVCSIFVKDCGFVHCIIYIMALVSQPAF
jgi:hypothetical protein